MNDHELICKILDDQGIFYSDDIIDKDIVNSIQYISVIVELEKEFSIEFPDKYLVNSILTSISDIASLIKQIKSENLQ
jgi:acyl carrier protein